MHLIIGAKSSFNPFGTKGDCSQILICSGTRSLILDSTTLAITGIGSLLFLFCCWRRLLNLEDGTDGLFFLCEIGVAEEEVGIGTVEELGHGLLNLSGMEMDEILEVRVGLVEDEGEDDGFGGTGSS